MVFKKQYYCFIAGLPDIAFDTTKIPFEVNEFRHMLMEILSPKDLKFIEKYFLDVDNKNLMLFLKDKHAPLNTEGKWKANSFQQLITQIQEDTPIKNKHLPHYFKIFIKEWMDAEEQQEHKLWEDLMTELYMEYGSSIKNTLIAKWFEFNLNINNVFSAIFARKHNLDLKNIIIGKNHIANTIRNNASARDFGLDMELNYFEPLLRLSEESDIFERERRIDKFRWEWLDSNIIFDYFNLEYIFAYLCKLQILERWVNLNAEEGEKVFRQLISQLKNDVEVSDEH